MRVCGRFEGLTQLLSALLVVPLALAVALALAESDAPAAVVLFAAALMVGLCAARLSSRAVSAFGSSGVGRRARAHRQALDSVPEPQHPKTAGRPRTRAPALVAATA
ncbi:hypothetical protein OH146_03285 [Salinibacterium sp. SYSU T00001]|uniref:hypothetical protein n=1 Tax=Homoserinimonas sedimenticola TaxID=2986805 RepID=UPI002235A9B9|nr:hypothetical protein [Salinibacterium sedimenticola]MCW4384793.1 hypothetical protein [Salinibacterium sedimenticola]